MDSEFFTSETTTRGVHVRVRSQFDPHRSHLDQQLWFFLYTVTITNQGEGTVQLLSRHWIIRDETGQVQEVKGQGVVGEQPVLEPGESFEYTSGCPLSTATGTMEGTYGMVDAEGEAFEAQIGAFVLSEPLTVH
ncbi:MAG: Co2+/Mg2+ efflux protein ApaG [Acidobacteriota bacterium]